MRRCDQVLVMCLVFTILPAAGVRADRLRQAQGGASEKNEYDLPSDLTAPTPELWFYLQQQRRYDNPEMVVRRNAEHRAAGRRSRIAARQWFGLSNQRPLANPTPWFGTYSPMWVAGLWEPYSWVGMGLPAVTLAIDANEGAVQK